MELPFGGRIASQQKSTSRRLQVKQHSALTGHGGALINCGFTFTASGMRTRSTTGCILPAFRNKKIPHKGAVTRSDMPPLCFLTGFPDFPTSARTIAAENHAFPCRYGLPDPVFPGERAAARLFAAPDLHTPWSALFSESDRIAYGRPSFQALDSGCDNI